MDDSRIHRAMLATALLAGSAMPFVYVVPVRAQTAGARALPGQSPTAVRTAADSQVREQNAGAAGNRKPGQAPPPARYPLTTRAEPPAKASKASSPTLQKIIEAYKAGDVATVASLADGVLADPKANDFDRAFASRMAGVALLKTNPTKASDNLKRALQFNSLGNTDHYDAMTLLAQLQLDSGRYSEALATLDRFFVETRSQDPEQLALKGNALYRLKRYPEAATVLKQAITASPQPPADWLQLLMGTYLDANQPEAATRVADELIAKTPNDRALQMNLAAVYIQARQNDKAAAVLEKIRAAGQLTDEKDYRNLYSLYFNLPGKEKEAVAVIDDGLQKGVLKPDLRTYSALAQGYYFSGQPALAIGAYKKAAPLASDGEMYLNLAKVLSKEGRAAEAAQAATQALAKGVRNPAEARALVAGKVKQ